MPLILTIKKGIMKKLNKLKLEGQLLNEDELKMLVGGYDIINKNTDYSCHCVYNNTSYSVSNDNSITGCQCHCKSY